MFIYGLLVICKMNSSIRNDILVMGGWIKIDISSATGWTGTAHHSGAPQLNPGFSEVLVTRSLVLCVMFCRLFFFPFALFLLAIVLSFFDLRILITPLISSNYSLAFLEYFVLYINSQDMCAASLCCQSHVLQCPYIQVWNKLVQL
jgi:hypothetical protein